MDIPSSVTETQGINEIVHFEQSGKQTSLTPEIQQIATGIQGNAIDKTNQILTFMRSLRTTNFDKKVFRKRTAADIIRDGFITGCTDADIVFVTVARASGLPAKYIETIDKTWLEEGGSSIRGHQYAQVYDEQAKLWFWVDPMGNRVNIPPPEKDNREIYAVGLDSWDIGITDFDSLSKKFNEFRKQRLQKAAS